MVISRSDIKRRRRDSDDNFDTLPDSPKRTKVHAQRKFAQGSNVSSPVITPVKEIEKDKVKIPEILPPPSDLLSQTPRPNTEDFLTFLCFRGTSILPPSLDFFNTANTVSVATQSKEPEKTNDTPEKTDRPFIAFGVRKRADPFVSSKLEKKRRHAIALQTLRRKYQEQRMAKIRAHTIEKMTQGVKIKKQTIVRTRSVTKVTQKDEKVSTKSKNVKILPKRVVPSTVKVSTVKRPIIKQKMCLRSRGKFIHRELTARPKLKRPIIKKKVIPPKRDKSSSEFSSDDDQPLVKTIKKAKIVTRTQKLIRKVVPVKNESVRITRSTPILKQKAIIKKKDVQTKEKSESSKVSKEKVDIPETSITQRPSRKTKEAASLYMNLLGPKLVTSPAISDDDSIDSFPELPNVRKTEQREIEMKATVSNKTNRVTRKSTEISKKNIDVTLRNKADITKKLDDKTKNKEDKKNIEEKSNKITVKKNLEEKPKKKEQEKKNEDRSKIKETEKKINIEKSKKKDLEKKNEDKIKTKPTEKKNIDDKTKINETVEEKSNKDIVKRNIEEITINKETSKKNIDQKTKVIPKKNFEEKTKINELTSDIKTKIKPIEGQTKKLHPIKKDIKQDVAINAKDDIKLRSNKIISKPKKLIVPIATLKKLDSFSDSDEEPLVKLKTKKVLPAKKPNEIKIQRKPEELLPMKTRSKQVNKDSNSFPLSDDDEAFRGFVKTEETNLSQTILKQSISLHSETKITTDLLRKDIKRLSKEKPILTDKLKISNTVSKEKELNLNKKVIEQKPEKIAKSADLLCKDIGRRFGKGKVNMSNEQIEKWLNDSAEECKKDLDKKLYCNDTEEKEKLKTNIKDIICEPIEIKTEIKMDTSIEAQINNSDDSLKFDKTPPERKCIFQQRRSIINKSAERKDIPNSKAFSANNESSVYAFEAEFEMPVSTPFRSQIRRPSSTITSKSEEEAQKFEDEKKKPNVENNRPSTSKSEISTQVDVKKQEFDKFRLPTMMKKAQGKELSVTLSDEHNSASIAVQVNLDSSLENNVSMECSTQTDTENGEGQIFYIPLQSKQAQSIIQGVAVKLGTEGNNQKIVMHAKLVTQSPDNKLPTINQKPLAQNVHMCPPIGTVQPTYRPKSETTKNKPNEFKTDPNSTSDPKNIIPSSPSASSSSSAKISKAKLSKVRRSLEPCLPTNKSEFPSLESSPKLVEALVFRPTEKEFQDPIEFIEKIRPQAEKFGICRIIPPANFKPECKVSDDMRFTAYNQYVEKMLHRWGPNFKELMAIKKYLATQSITLTHPPWIGGMEIDLPRLYQTVQTLGGLKEVIEKKRWPKVAEGMKIPKSAQDRVTKLDDIYCKYLLPYDTLSHAEREKLFDEIETDWAKHESRILSRQNENVSNDNDSESESDDEAEECITKGRNMALNAFYRIARNTMSMWFKTTEPSADEVENEFWRHVNNRQNHICVHSGSIDSGGWGYGFCCNKNSPFARHPWNLKILTNNSGSVLRSLGPVMGVTVPTLHVGMVFSACCWYRDPHGLPWIEYLHTGASKIWYGIPDTYSQKFQQALKKLVPNYIRNKTLWLPSDTAMVPPNLLTQNGVSLCRTVQEPGQFIVVFPKAFTSSICSGYVVSESVYFASRNWLLTAKQVFRDIRESCEPAMFSWERLLISIASDQRSNSEVLKQILPEIEVLVAHEKEMRQKLEKLGLVTLERLPLPENNGKRKKKLQEDDGEYECEICRANLFVSMVTNSHEEGIYCLDHAIEHIEKKPNQLKYFKLLFTHNMKELDGLIERIKSNIELKTQKKIPSKFAGMATLLK